MPEYVYRAVTSKGQIVRNRVEDVNRNTLIKKLKNNDLLPISIVQVGYHSNKKKVNRKNMMDIDDIMKQADSANIMRGISSAAVEQQSGVEQVNRAVSEMDGATQMNNALVNDAENASKDLVAQANSLQQAMKFFKL